jgi:DNA (cytosine-5)-methyltransferase 1
MRRVTSADTTPELLLRQALRAKKFRYQVNNTQLPGKPDLVFAKSRVAVFVDGDFWHGGQWRKRKLAALEEQFTGNKNKEYWLKKIRRNMERDCVATADLIAQGWTVLRFWERDIEKRLEECVRIIASALEDDCERSGYKPLSVIPRRTVAGFFAGIGLMSIGLQKEGWTMAFTHEPDPVKRRIYEGSFGKWKRFFEGDLPRISGELIPEVTLATAFFTVNDFLLTGAGEGLRGRTSTFWEFIRIIREMGERKPPIVLLESKLEVLSLQSGNGLKEALGAFNYLGYQVDAFILEAASFVPLRRKSLFVLGILDSLGEEGIQNPLRDWESEVRPKPLVEFITQHLEIRWRIRDLPACPKRAIELKDVVEEFPEDSELWWSVERAGYLFSQMNPQDQAEALRMMNQEKYMYGMIQRQLQFEESRVELRTNGVAGDATVSPGSEQMLFKAGKGKYFVRQLAPREWARLMGVADYQISVPPNQAIDGFENTVCAPMIQWIARYYLNPLVCELLRGKPIRPAFKGEGIKGR